MNKWIVGEVEITRVLEFECPLLDPLDLFPNGSYYYKNHKNIQPYMIHFNYTETAEDKRKIMKKYKKWLI